MPRTRRNWVPTLGAHIISRFVDRNFFLADEVDRQQLLAAIGRADRLWDWRWLSWALMSTHVHYATLPGTKNPDRFFASAHTSFAKRFHLRREGSTLGPVFASRPDIHAVEHSMLLRTVAYQHRNPPDAKVVERPSESRWTSHRIYLRLDPAPAFFDVEWALSVLGFDDTTAGRKAFDEFVTEVDLTDFVPAAVRREEPVLRSEPGTADWSRLEGAARQLTGLPRAIPLASRKKAAVLTRWLVVQVATIDLDQPYSATAAAVGITPGAVCNLIHRGLAAPEAPALEAELRRRLGLAA